MNDIQYVMSADIESLRNTPTNCDFIFFDDHIGTDGEPGSVENCISVIQSLSPKKAIFDYMDLGSFKPQFDFLCSPVPIQFLKSIVELNLYTKSKEWVQKTGVFNFSINKPRHNRLSCLQYLNNHALHTKHYSLTGTRDQQHHNWPPKSYLEDGMVQIQTQILNKHFRNAHIYEKHLRYNVYEPTFVSLITEPGWASQACFISEKTLYAFDSGTIPIWVGGWGIPQKMKELGFCVFDDIVDHSYQCLPDPQQRIDFALEKNRHLLKDAGLVQEYFESNRSLFVHNQHKCRDFHSISNYFMQNTVREGFEILDYYKVLEKFVMS